MSDERKLLPLKVVPPLQRDFYKPQTGGGAKKVFAPVNPEFRGMLAAQIIDVRDHFVTAFKEFPDVPAVARAKVRPDAVAKSHRPTTLLSPKTCPIIGAEGLGELLLSVTPKGLENLARRIETDNSQDAIANLSTLQSFEAYHPFIEQPKDSIAKVKLFRHHDQGVACWTPSGPLNITQRLFPSEFLRTCLSLRGGQIDEVTRKDRERNFRQRGSQSSQNLCWACRIGQSELVS